MHQNGTVAKQVTIATRCQHFQRFAFVVVDDVSPPVVQVVVLVFAPEMRKMPEPPGEVIKMVAVPGLAGNQLGFLKKKGIALPVGRKTEYFRRIAVVVVGRAIGWKVNIAQVRQKTTSGKRCLM